LISGLKPYGKKDRGEGEGSVFLHLEEYEALRLCDHEMMNHHQAAVIMNVSRPTLTRIYAMARRKIAEALVLGKQVVIEGGKVYYDSEWYSCAACGCFFNDPEKERQISQCPLCSSDRISAYAKGFNPDQEPGHKVADTCICPVCGFESLHVPGRPCKDEICPECNTTMVRKGAPPDRRSKNTR
jgi:predicted DNA-binding protein (UPF0251 family)